MLFNSIPFIAVFLPITLLVTFLLAARVSSRAALAWLAFASIVFYGYWRIEDVPVLLGSIAANYLIGRKLQERPSRGLLALGIAGNLVLLGYFKYLTFITLTANAALGDPLTVPQIVLPLGISFYTFQQIAYLVDSHGGVVKERHPLHYLFFVSFFPQLIAGPIVHHAEVMPQLRKTAALRFDLDDFSIGLTGWSRRRTASSTPLSTVAHLHLSRLGEARSLTRSRSISISPAIRTWRSGSPGWWGSGCRSTSPRLTRRRASSSSGPAGTSP
jgi:alginate O-acetyltransferase complex protein AlgI